jgi:cephalosporin hydroxylase
LLKQIHKLGQSLTKRTYRRPLLVRAITRAFHRVYYYAPHTWHDTQVFGVPIRKCPLDLWIYQDILHEVRPDLIVECGTHKGGSAYYFGMLLDHLGAGKVVTVDIEDMKAGLPTHPRVTYLIGSSVSDEIVQQIRAMTDRAERVMVVLDSDHSRDHVLRELQRYCGFVTPGSYLVVEDTNLNGHPIQSAHGPGPMEAVDAFLDENADFEVDASRERLLMTFNPRGYLRKRSTGT